jgi:hypothetical protein
MRTRSVTTLSWAQTAALNPAKPICRTCGAELAAISVRPRTLYCRRRRSLDNSQHCKHCLGPLAAGDLSLASAGA